LWVHDRAWSYNHPEAGGEAGVSTFAPGRLSFLRFTNLISKLQMRLVSTELLSTNFHLSVWTTSSHTNLPISTSAPLTYYYASSIPWVSQPHNYTSRGPTWMYGSTQWTVPCWYHNTLTPAPLHIASPLQTEALRLRLLISDIRRSSGISTAETDDDYGNALQRLENEKMIYPSCTNNFKSIHLAVALRGHL